MSFNPADHESWLDTATKASLQQVPPQKIAPATTEAFGIVVLTEPKFDPRRVRRAFQRVLATSSEEAARHSVRQTPFVLKQELTLAGAMLAQFELICCDIVSVFVADDVLTNAEPNYLEDLYRSLVRSEEFAMVPFRVEQVPDNERGHSFIDQFLGFDISSLPCDLMMTRKKMRIMYHWAEQIGATVSTLPPS